MDVSSDKYQEYRDLLEGALAIIGKYNDRNYKGSHDY